MTANEMSERQRTQAAMDREMARLHSKPDCWTLEDIGKHFPINSKPRTKQAVSIAIRRHADATNTKVPSERGRSRDSVNAHTIRAEERKGIAEGLLRQGYDDRQIAGELGIGIKTARGYLSGVPGYSPRRGRPSGPSKSALSYEEIVRRRVDEDEPIDSISIAAGVTPARISQVLQHSGLYTPQPETLGRMSVSLGLLASDVPVPEIAERVGRSTSQVYSYLSLGRAIGLSDDAGEES